MSMLSALPVTAPAGKPPPSILAREQLSGEILEKLSGFGGQGYCKLEMIPNRDDNEAQAYLRPLTQLFSLRRLTPEEFLRQKQELTLKMLRRQVRERGHDLDPTTEERVQ